MTPKKAANTEAAYAVSWNLFAAWCATNGYEPLPASFDAMSLYAAYLLEGRRFRLSTVRVRLSGIADRHIAAGYASPFDTRIRAMLSHAARERRERPRYKLAVTPDQVRALAALTTSTRTKDIRDGAISLLAFATGWRRGELLSLDLADVRFVKDAGVILSLGASKTDQEAKGRQVSVPYNQRNPTVCPVRRLEDWIAARGADPGPLFRRLDCRGGVLAGRLGGRWLCCSMQHLLTRIGVKNPKSYGFHSYRAGFITAAKLAGADDRSIMNSTGHRSAESVFRYVRPLEGFRHYPLDGVL